MLFFFFSKSNWRIRCLSKSRGSGIERKSSCNGLGWTKYRDALSRNKEKSKLNILNSKKQDSYSSTKRKIRGSAGVWGPVQGWRVSGVCGVCGSGIWRFWGQQAFTLWNKISLTCQIVFELCSNWNLVRLLEYVVSTLWTRCVDNMCSW